MTRNLLLATAAAFAAGCSSVPFEHVGTQPLRNAMGHVIGEKEVLCDCRSGEQLTRFSLYVPRHENGRLVGYEERVKGGAILRDLNGKAIGNRFADLRSRGTNAQNSITVVFVQPVSARSAVAVMPTIDELMQLGRVELARLN